MHCFKTFQWQETTYIHTAKSDTEVYSFYNQHNKTVFHCLVYSCWTAAEIFVGMQKRNSLTVCSNTDHPCRVQSQQRDRIVDSGVETLWFYFKHVESDSGSGDCSERWAHGSELSYFLQEMLTTTHVQTVNVQRRLLVLNTNQAAPLIFRRPLISPKCKSCLLSGWRGQRRAAGN